MRLSAYHRLPEVPAGALESGKVFDPWNSNRNAQPEMGQPGTQWCATELSGNGTTPRHATTPEFKNHHQWIVKAPEVNTSLRLTPNLHSAPGT